MKNKELKIRKSFLKSIFRSLIFYLIYAFILFPQITQAQAPSVTPGAPIPGGSGSYTGEQGFAQYIGEIFRYGSYLAIALAILMIIYGGFKYAGSAGNPEAMGESKELITGAIIGLIVLVLAYLILSTVGPGIVQP